MLGHIWALLQLLVTDAYGFWQWVWLTIEPKCLCVLPRAYIHNIVQALGVTLYIQNRGCLLECIEVYAMRIRFGHVHCNAGVCR